jgi:iron complex outermembrane receptor protein
MVPALIQEFRTAEGEHMNRKYLALAIAGALSVPFSPLAAQQRAESDMMLEEVTVTARKRQETLQDVPFSVAARTEQQMRESGLVSIEDVSRTVASFSVQNLGPGQSQVAIRGASAGQIVRDQPGVKEQVGVYLDESVISLSLFTPDIDLFDMNRVEVLRGPQGTLYGSGSLSGTVRYISNQPDLEAFSSAVEANLSTIDNGGSGGYAKAYINTPMGDNAAARVVAWYNETPGWIAAHQPDGSVHTDVNDGTVEGVRAAIRVETSDQFSITPRVIYQKVETDGWNRQDAFNILGNPYTTTRPAVTLGEHEQYTQFEEPFSDEFLLLDLNLEYQFASEMVLNSITTYTNRDILVVRDATALTASITGGTIGLSEEVYTLDAPLDDGTKASGWTQELRLSGESGNFTWVGGMFYSDFERDYVQGLLVSGFEDLTGIPTAGFIAPKDGLYWSELEYDFKQLAVFGEATWALTERLDLTAGLRYYDFDESRIQSFDGIFADPGTNYGDTTADGFAPRVMADWALTDEVSINGQVSKGFRLGGINDPLNVPLCTPQDLETFSGRENWDDEELWNYEVGMKSLFMGGRGTFNVAVFYQDIKDLQATVTAGSCSSRVVFNVPEAHSAGIEMELAMQATERFDFALTGSFIEAKLDSTVTSTQSDGSLVVVGGIQDGNRLATVPELQAAAAANYVFPMMGEWEGYLNGIVQYVGDRYTQIGDQAEGFGTVNLLSFGDNTIGGPLTQSTFTFNPLLPSYTVANARFGMRNGRWDVALYVNNLTDELAFLALDQERNTRARVGYLVNQPRTYGITARVSF